jgi:hypothetical protein
VKLTAGADAARPRGHAPGPSGYAFQFEVAALLAAHVLEGSAPHPFELTSDVRLTRLHLEARAEMDDVVTETSAGGRCFVQAKRGRLEASARRGSPFAKAVGQLARQWLTCRRGGGGPFDDRPLDRRDRLVIACDGGASRKVVRDLAHALAVWQADGEDSPAWCDVPTKQRAALDVLRGAIREAYAEASGETLDAQDELEILSLIRIWWIGEGAQERAAPLLARLVDESADAALAWDALVALTMERSGPRGSLDESRLRRHLSERGIPLAGAPRHGRAIEHVRRVSEKGRGRLAEHAGIRVDPRTIQVPREIHAAAVAAARSGSLLITGDPGEGKSGLLHAIGESLRGEGREVLHFEADPATPASLPRLDVFADAPLADVLRVWPHGPPIVLIDALDTCREPAARREWHLLLDALLSSPGGPTVVVTVRSFDLRYDARLGELFAGAPVLPSRQYGVMARVRHVHVPPLTDAELSQIAAQWPLLENLLSRASEAMLELARTLFHLRILCELLARGDSVPELGQVATPIELLDRYWRHRVKGADEGRQPDGYAAERRREDVVTAIGRDMVKRRALEIARRSEALTDHEATEQLLVAGVLVEGEDTLRFFHHAFADYAIEQVVLPQSLEALAEQIRDDPAACFFAAPSLRLRLSRLWASQSHEDYWKLLRRLAGEEAIRPSLAAFVAGTAATQTTTPDDLAGLLRDLAVMPAPAAERLLFWLRVALAARQMEGAALAGTDHAAWDVFLERGVHSRGDLAIAWAKVFDVLRGDAGTPTAAERQMRTRAVVHIFDGLDALPEDAPGASWARSAIVRELASAVRDLPDLVRAPLTRCLAPDALRRHRMADLEILCDAAGTLAVAVPDLARKLYAAAVGLTPSRDIAIIRGSATLSLSLREVDVHAHALSKLASAFPALLDASFAEGTSALLAVLAHHSHEPTAEARVTFRLAGSEGWLLRDELLVDLALEDATVSRERPVLEIVRTFCAALARRSDDRNADALWNTLAQLAAQCHAGGLWAELLRAGATAPETLGVHLRELAGSPEILATHLLAEPLAAWGAAVFPQLDMSSRRDLEARALATARASESGRRLPAGAQALISSIAPADLALLELRELRDALEAGRRESTHVLRGQPQSSSHWAPYTTGDWLKERGVDPSTPAHAPILEAARAVEAASLACRGEAEPAIEPLTAAIERLESALQEHGELAPDVDAHARAAWLRGWRRLLDATWHDAPLPIVLRARTAYLAARSHPAPYVLPSAEAEFESAPAFGNEDVRVFAAEGLVQIAALRDGDLEVLRALEDLAGDPAPEVRHVIARGLRFLAHDASEAARALAIRMLREEPNRYVLRFLVTESLSALFRGSAVAQLAERLAELLERFPAASENDDLRRSALALVLDLHVFGGIAAAARLVRTALDRLPADAGVTKTLVLLRVGTLTQREDVRGGRTAASVRRAAIELLHDVVARVSPLVSQLDARFATSGADAREQIVEQYRDLQGMLGVIARQVVYAVDRYELEATRPGASEEERALLRMRLWTEASALLDRLASAPLPAHDADDFVGFVASYVDDDPSAVLARVKALLPPARRSGLTSDRRGSARFVALCRHLIVRHAERIATDDAHASILDILDALVLAEWPEAEVLAAQLQDVWR